MPKTDSQGAKTAERDAAGKLDEFRRDDDAARKASHAETVVHRRVLAKGGGGVTSTIVVVVRQGKVSLSVVPPFTWEAILDPEKVDQLVRILGQAREDAQRMASRRIRKTSQARPAVRGSHEGRRSLDEEG